MRAKGSLSWPRALLLALPLVGLAAWLTVGALARSFGPEPLETGLARESGTALASLEETKAASPPSLLPPPEEEYRAETLFDRVDGAADFLLSHGCERLLVWRFRDPAAELELLVFGGAAGAGAVMERDAGNERTPGPGDEAWAGPEVVYFRRGRLYARLFAVAGAPPPPGALADLGARIDAELVRRAARGAP
jgi:hypothetical protein